ncbi:MAG: hypothetical protein U1A77_10285 [Pirellulales bacterium]
MNVKRSFVVHYRTFCIQLCLATLVTIPVVAIISAQEKSAVDTPTVSDTPKDDSVVEPLRSSLTIDLDKPVSINLVPATPLAKSLVELFAQRGAKVLDYEEGKRLRIQAPPQVLEKLGQILAVIASEGQGFDRKSGEGESSTKPVRTPASVPEKPAIGGTSTLNSTPSRQRPTKTSYLSLPDTTAAKELVERLDAQEHAAASEANEIRRLRANGDAAETIEPHHAHLKAHLQTAFELKLQLEELQLRELQSRLGRLERQIAHRKELREKIIERRAADLISGDSLRWNTK